MILWSCWSSQQAAASSHGFHIEPEATAVDDGVWSCMPSIQPMLPCHASHNYEVTAFKGCLLESADVVLRAVHLKVSQGLSWVRHPIVIFVS